MNYSKKHLKAIYRKFYFPFLSYKEFLYYTEDMIRVNKYYKVIIPRCCKSQFEWGE